MRLSRLLVVDLASRAAQTEPLPPEERRFLGGAALGVKLLERFGAPGLDPLDPRAPWIVSVGPLTGTLLAPRPQAVITHLSPLTGGINDSVVTHPLAEALAGTGIAALVLIGASESPVWLRLRDGRVEFEDARHLWGMDLGRTGAALEAAAGSPPLAAGPAAERGVLYACVGSRGHSAGRGGTGAALAAKLVKAIAAPKTRSPAGPEGAAGREPRGGRALERLRGIDERRGLPTRNFRERKFEKAQELTRQLEPLAESRRLPFEGIYAFGPLLGVSDAAAVLRCLDACDRLGLDVISAGGTLAWGIEATETGALDAGLPRFGEGDDLARWVERIARREGAGDLLALGSRRAAERLGRGSDYLAMHVRGLEIPGYDPRAFPSLALGYAVGSRGACHVRSGAYEADFDDPLPDPPDPAEVARRAAEFEDRSALLDSLILSRSWRADLGEPFSGAARLLRDAGEQDRADPESLRETMREVADARRRMNLARGWDPAGDTLPARLLTEEGGAPSTIDADRLRRWVAAYYSHRGWNARGEPR